MGNSQKAEGSRRGSYTKEGACLSGQRIDKKEKTRQERNPPCRG